MKIMFFSQFASGHNIEYLHHYYEMAVNTPRLEFFFIVPYAFIKDSKSLDWPNKENIHFDYIPDDIYFRYTSSMHPLKKSLLLSKLLRSYIMKYKPDKVMLTVIMTFMPFLPFLVMKKHLVSGIIYKIYLYESEKHRIKNKLSNWLKYILFSKMAVFDRLFILNDQKSADYFCKKYSSCRFNYLPDPYLPIECEDGDFREKNGLNTDDVLFAHIGDLTTRKGTLDILESLKTLPKNKKGKYVFVFAGRVNKDINDRFYKILELLERDDVRIIVKDAFCSFQYFGSLCKAADALVIPYHGTAQSSGVLGYASQFCTPVIAPNSGVVGRLVKEFDLGILLSEISSTALQQAYLTIEEKKPIVSKHYCIANSVVAFEETLMKKWILN